VRQQVVQRGPRCGDEAWLEQQVLGRVSGERQLGKKDDVGCGGAGLRQAGPDLGGVAVDVADREVELGQCDSQHGHGRARGSRPERIIGGGAARGQLEAERPIGDHAAA
jgi:hypothetical protein